ncbi:aspartate/glutamate racemase family protein [Roseovarius sp. SCSIO 43702]|uniref:aspartate/glutamate racemase family protein n=1 Tax=Roseovarius sp. SCSIO 43702 TaxID=2823043 RepID=UPI001C72B101|nr:aspartate/glutamate racemase family protein [Roseovarius sp. SCSIO 43702]QYX56187.1 aspartate/glutamate racemase family protein [Roseovarius sp. SCSIO 43702]
MTGPILFINPNSSRKVTDGIADALAPLRLSNGPGFEAAQIDDGPATIASAEDVARASVDVLEMARSRPDCTAFVTACFSDPGLDLLRTTLPQPSFGLMECGIFTAMARADLFGIVALGPGSVARHRLRIRAMGVEGRLAGELALDNVSAEATGHDDTVFEATLELGKRLKALGAGALVLGCAGFAPRRAALEEKLGIAVIDPVQAAGAMALGAVLKS